MTTRTIDQALEKFHLVKNSAGDGDKTACLTSLLNWVSGEDVWGDSFQCASPLIRSLMIAYNDDPEITQEQMDEAGHLGVTGAIDTWWIPTEVVLSYYGDFEREATPTRHERMVKMLTGVSVWKLNKVRRYLNRANLNGANLDEANLDGANLYGANLYGANLNGANLDGANLNGANLYRANLDGANLDGANLDGANLNGASLNGASLYGASLDGANLDGANLDGANLYRASLYRANLDGANLNGANLNGASLYRANLNGANLDGANLNGALYLSDALNLDKTIGEPASLPSGWEFKNGLIVKKS